MNSKRSLVCVALLCATAMLVGCKEKTPAPTAEPSPSADALSVRPKLNLKTPLAPMPKVDPQTLKEYRADVCYFGSLSLLQARDAYLSSLGKDEPSEKKIPSFGGAPTAPVAARPGATDAAKPAVPTVGPIRDARGRPDSTQRAPYERNARACVVASNVKEPSMGDVDAAIAAFAPLSLELAKTIATASGYYQREEYKQDKFAKGKELHKQLVDQFGKLGDLQQKVGDSISAYRAAHSVDVSTLSDGEKATHQVVDAARVVMLELLSKTVDASAYQANVAKLAAAVEALKTQGAGNRKEPWEKVLMPSLKAFLTQAQELKLSEKDKSVSPEDRFAASTKFTAVIEANQRATSRALVARAQAAEAAEGEAP